MSDEKKEKGREGLRPGGPEDKLNGVGFGSRTDLAMLAAKSDDVVLSAASDMTVLAAASDQAALAAASDQAMLADASDQAMLADASDQAMLADTSDQAWLDAASEEIRKHGELSSVTARKGLSDNIALLAPAGADKLNPSQRSEVQRYLAKRIQESDELLGAVTRKIRKVLAADDDCS